MGKNLDDFIREANRSATLKAAEEDAEKMTAEEIARYLINGGFKEAEAWETAEKLKQGEKSKN